MGEMLGEILGALVPRSGLDFAIVSVLMGGLAAYATGRALAGTWRPAWQLVPNMIGLAAVVRFCHFALFGDTLLEPAGYMRDLGLALLAAWFGYRQVRVAQTLGQYAWLYEPAGFLRWRARR